MDRRDVEYIKRLMTAWGFYVRSGRCFQNILGYPQRSVEYSMMRGDIGGNHVKTSKVPVWVHIDKQIEATDTAVIGMESELQYPVACYYLKGMPERDISIVLDISRRQIRKRLYNAYDCVFGLVFADQK